MSQQTRRIVEITEGGKAYPVTSLVKSHPEMAATVSKLVSSSISNASFGARGERSITQPARNMFMATSQEIIHSSRDAEAMLQLFPELELSAQILVSSVISPKDMTSTDISVSLDSNFFTPDITNKLVDLVKDYLNKDYKIKPKLSEILRDMLFEHGSHPIVVIPESSLDEFINGTRPIGMEGLSEYYDTSKKSFKSLGILGDPTSDAKTRVGMENFAPYAQPVDYDAALVFNVNKRDKHISVTDNIFALRFPEIQAKQRRNTVRNLYKAKSTLGVESHVPLTDAKMYGLVYKNQNTGYTPFNRLKTSSQTQRNNVGAPLIMHLPSEAVIPVHVPGDEKKHIGYFLMIDGEGNPLSRSSLMSLQGGLGDRLNQANTDMSSYMLQRTNRNINGTDCSNLTMTQASQVYGDIIEADLLERLRKGVYGDNVSIARNEEVYRIMLSRTLANKHTQLLYVPVELMTYFAYKYDANGVGKSILDDLKMINSLRAMLTFAKTMAALKNSVGRTEVRLKLDENDPDPRQSVETAIHEITSMRGQQMFPLGISSPADLATWVQKAGYEFTFEGHPDIPDMNIEFNEKNSNYVKPDDELYTELKKSSIMGTGISPETVDAGFGPDFATSVLTNNILLVKRVLQIQSVFIPQLTDHCRTVLRNHGGLLNDIRSAIKENLARIVDRTKNNPEIQELDESDSSILEFLVYEFIDNLEITLPSPDITTLENQMLAFSNYSEALDKALDAYVGEGIINSEMSGELGNNAAMYKAIIKAYYQRKWLADNNTLSELGELVSKGEDGNPVVNFMEAQKDHINAITASLANLAVKTKPVAQAADKELSRVTDGEGSDSVAIDTSTDAGSTDTEEPSADEADGLDGGEFNMPQF